VWWGRRLQKERVSSPRFLIPFFYRHESLLASHGIATFTACHPMTVDE
jgi:hypothetical protein